MELGVRDDPEDEPIYYRYEDWINIWEDKYSVELDYSDARYLFRRRKTDLDIAVAMFPDHASDLIAAAAKAGEIASYDEIIMDDDTDVGGEDGNLRIRHDHGLHWLNAGIYSRNVARYLRAKILVPFRGAYTRKITSTWFN